MIGVVLWSDPCDRKAVVWCEDQGDLAFLSEHATLDVHDAFFEIGDVLQFDVTLERTYRRASNPRLVQEGAGLAAVGELKASAQPQPDGGNVIPFRPDIAVRDRRRKQGSAARNA